MAGWLSTVAALGLFQRAIDGHDVEVALERADPVAVPTVTGGVSSASALLNPRHG